MQRQLKYSTLVCDAAIRPYCRSSLARSVISASSSFYTLYAMSSLLRTALDDRCATRVRSQGHDSPHTNRYDRTLVSPLSCYDPMVVALRTGPCGTRYRDPVRTEPCVTCQVAHPPLQWFTARTINKLTSVTLAVEGGSS